MRAYELGDITGLIKSKGLLHRLLTGKCVAAADGAHSVGGFQFLHDLVTCGGCQASHRHEYVHLGLA